MNSRGIGTSNQPNLRGTVFILYAKELSQGKPFYLKQFSFITFPVYGLETAPCNVLSFVIKPGILVSERAAWV